jgi:hypothetical protein
MTPEDYPGELGTSYEQACAELRVPPLPAGYGVLLDQDGDGARWTRVTTDASGIRSVASIWHMGLQAGYEPPAGTVRATLPGWPVEHALAIPGLPRPHDPPGAAGVLRPPGRAWSPARRRALADAIARELADTGHQSAEEYAEGERWDAANMGDTDLLDPPPRYIDLRQALGPDHPARPAADHAIAAAWSLAAAGQPPPGSARTARAWPAPARMVRATGDGWTLAARTGGGPAVLLLDDIPGIPVDITDAPQLDQLLDALTAAADRAQLS